MSASISSRQKAPPLMSNEAAAAAASPSGLPLSKSQQLARALIHSADASQPVSPHFRPDSQWSEGGADVVWQGSKGFGAAAAAMPSPRIQSSFRPSTEEFQAEFADAHEGSDSEEMHSASADDNTIFTTLSTSGSSVKKSHGLSAALQSPSHAPMPLGAAKTNVLAPIRPQRKAPRPPLPIDHSAGLDEQGDEEEDEADEMQSHFGHARNTSIGSSIWAGRGARSSANDERPPLPSLPNGDSKSSPMLDSVHPRPGRASVAETSSVYSQGAGTEWDAKSAYDAQRMLEQTPPLDRLRHMGTTSSPNAARSDFEGGGNVRDDEFEMMDTQSIYEGRTTSNVGLPSSFAPTSAQPQRRLPDGTIVPKMPPMPSEHGIAFENPKPRSRSQKGRKNRSPILSYADGEEEERRLVQESELREHGGVEGLATSSSLGPRLKKNSPAPWEMDDELEGGRGSLSQFSNEGMSASRPSMENLFGASGMKNPSSWARQSMENFRHRSTSNSNGLSAASQNGKQSTNAFPSTSSQYNLPGSSPLANSDALSATNSTSTGSNMPSSSEDSAPVRRTRTKSVSGSAAGMLKGLGLATQATGPAKKASSSRLAKAFRSSSSKADKVAAAGGSGTITGSNKQASLNLSRGISSDDYAHLPPSPPMNNNSMLSVSQSPYMATSSANSHSSLSHRSDAASTGEVSAAKPSPGLATSSSPPTMPVRKTSVGTASNSGASPQPFSSASTDNHAYGTSSSSTHSSHNVSKTVSEAIDQIIGAPSKARNQPPAPGSQVRSASASEAASVEHSISPKTPTSSSLHSSPMMYKSSPSFSQAQTPFGKPNTSSYPTGTAANAREAEQSSINSGHPSQESHRSSDVHKSVGGGLLQPPSASSETFGASTKPRVPGVGAHEGVPYKLISLEEARQQQMKMQQQQKVHRDDVGANVSTSASDKSFGDPALQSEREKSLKNKKSGGFLRRFGKDKGDGNQQAPGDDFGPLPSFGPSIQLQQAQHRETSNGVAAPPTLSVRPMSSMFTGLSASGLIDSDTFGGEQNEQRLSPRAGNQTLMADQLSPKTAMFPNSRGQARAPTNAALAPPLSPAITVASVDSHPSAGEYYDALERTSPQGDGTANKALVTGTFTPNDSRSLSAVSPAMIPTRRSSDSARSDSSSALGLVNGFPALPATGHGAIAASLTSKALASSNGEQPSLASATRQRALEIEAKMTELHAELLKLRSFAVDSGLASRPPPPPPSNGASLDASSPLVTQDERTEGEEILLPSSTPTTPAMTSSSGREDEGNGVDSQPHSPSTMTALHTPIPPCVQCGCSCAEQKRLQSLNELAILKGISVLDRGRALKPLAGQNGSKFGGYLDR